MSGAEEIRAVWKKQPEDFPVFLEENPGIFLKINTRQKKENEALVREFFQRIQKKLQQKPENQDDRKKRGSMGNLDFCYNWWMICRISMKIEGLEAIH